MAVMCIASFRTSSLDREALLPGSMASCSAYPNSRHIRPVARNPAFLMLRRCPGRLELPSLPKPPQGHINATSMRPQGLLVAKQ
jgi:hypothetical protein